VLYVNIHSLNILYLMMAFYQDLNMSIVPFFSVLHSCDCRPIHCYLFITVGCHT